MSGRTISAGEALLRSRLQEKLLKTASHQDKLVAAIMGTLTRISMMPDAAPIDSWKTPERGRTYRIAIVRSYKISYFTNNT